MQYFCETIGGEGRLIPCPKCNTDLKLVIDDHTQQVAEDETKTQHAEIKKWIDEDFPKNQKGEQGGEK